MLRRRNFVVPATANPHEWDICIGQDVAMPCGWLVPGIIIVKLNEHNVVLVCNKRLKDESKFTNALNVK
jgi:hypothetical protein